MMPNYELLYAWENCHTRLGKLFQGKSIVWDNIIGGSAESMMTETEMLDFIAQQSLFDLCESKFEI